MTRGEGPLRPMAPGDADLMNLVSVIGLNEDIPLPLFSRRLRIAQIARDTIVELLRVEARGSDQGADHA